MRNDPFLTERGTLPTLVLHRIKQLGEKWSGDTTIPLGLNREHVTYSTREADDLFLQELKKVGY